jgi:hypothetical protein
MENSKKTRTAIFFHNLICVSFRPSSFFIAHLSWSPVFIIRFKKKRIKNDQERCDCDEKTDERFLATLGTLSDVCFICQTLDQESLGTVRSREIS